ncbi:MAG: glucose-1-phosphate adenylyltransferase subunit GlgD [Oscillospiraceae bacterium]|nr:glucose-1-phosphate adenylyltransferase subunit GlgD [Oscillospiraceae bacterium]
MNNLHGILFAYHCNPRLRELTEHRTTSSIPFGGRYRIIDFMLSSYVNAGITDVGVILHESYQSLLDHLGSGKNWDLSRIRGGLKILPPFAYAKKRDGGKFRGEMEALAGVYTYLQQIHQDYVILGTGDLVANLPVGDIFKAHLDSGADITAVCVRPPVGEPEYTTYFSIGPNGLVSDVSCGGGNSLPYESLDVYILSKSLLLSLTDYCASHNLYGFSKDVLQNMGGTLSISPYIFQGYAARIQSSAAYYAKSMELFSPKVRSSLFHADHPIRTKVRSDPSTYYGPEAKPRNCLAADGCIIEGEVENSILFRGVRIEKDVRVKNCILLQDTVIRSGAILNCVIADKDVVINQGRMLMGHDSYPLVLAKDSVI